MVYCERTDFENFYISTERTWDRRSSCGSGGFGGGGEEEGSGEERLGIVGMSGKISQMSACYSMCSVK